MGDEWDIIVRTDLDDTFGSVAGPSWLRFHSEFCNLCGCLLRA